MRHALNREDYLHRPIKAGAEAISTIRFEPDTQFMMETDEFISSMQHVYGFEVTRRTLQLYSSPQFKLLSPPIHKGGHKSYYLHPEHTERLAAVLHLSTKLFMPLKAIRSLLRVYPERHYSLILKDVLTSRDLAQFVETFGHGLEVKDFLFYKVSRVLRALDDSPEPESLQDEATRERALFKMTAELERWINSDRRRRVEHVFYKKPKE
jgi:hypothetical protein